LISKEESIITDWGVYSFFFSFVKTKKVRKMRINSMRQEKNEETAIQKKTNGITVVVSLAVSFHLG
jgi:hypothetical protein